MSNGVIVEPTINLPLVDLSTGNVNFDGTINIKGDVKDGMKVYATGDVFIGGTVEAAEIVADGNIVIKGGVIGHSELSGDTNVAPTFNARVISKGSISARFAENVCMEANMDILITEFSMHNYLTSLNRIVVGKPGAKKGRIIGGLTCASNLVRTATLGTKSGLITKVRVGFNPFLQVQFDKLTLEIEAVEKELENIKKIIAFIGLHPEKDKDGLLNKLLHTREQFEVDCPRLHAEHLKVQSQMTLPEKVQIIVEEAVHAGTEIQLGNAICKNNQERGKGVFQIIDGAISFGSVF
ncbi:MAG: FapA family protein [Methylobacter sp.]|nr:FapA family protein [Methylobacter sp.]